MSTALEPRLVATVPAPTRRRPLPLARYAEFLPDAEALSERRHSPAARWLVLVLAAMVLSAVLWSALAKVDQVVTALGAVRPGDKVKIVNHPLGGRVSAVLVREGDHVTAGQPLLEIDSKALGEEAQKRRNDWQALAVAAARLEAEASGEALVFPADLAALRPDLVAAQTMLYEARRTAFEAAQRSLDESVRQHQHEAQSAAAKERQAAASLAIVKQQEEAVATLASKGYFPQLRYLSIKRDVAETEGAAAEAQQARAVAEAAVAEAVSRRDAAQRDHRASVLAELAEGRQNRDRAFQELQQAETELDNRVILAPADGTVEGLVVTAAGQAVRPNEEIMKIVPSDGGYVLDAMVANTDIGHVRIGQPARIKVLAFDYVRYGALEGVVERIAADALPDDKDRLVYKVEVRPLKDHLGPQPGIYALAPGMTAQIDLAVGKRSILAYLTDRMLNLTGEAFKER